MITIHLRGLKVVSKKNRLRWGKGRAYKTEEVVTFEGRLREECRALVSEPLKGAVSMTIEVTVPNKIRRDLQNFSDTICDALNGIVYEDDSQIYELKMKKIVSSEWDLLVTVKPLEEDNGRKTDR